MTDTLYDIVVLGGGSGGYACALRGAQLGLSVVLIEKDKLGGTCLHRGCIPTKALLHTAEVADAAKESEQFGVKATFEGIDMSAVNSYKDGVVTRLYKGLQGLAKTRGVTFVSGYGRLVSPDTVAVGDDLYRGRNVVLASGSVPKSLPGLQIDGARVISSDHALQLDHVPRSVVVLGGGVIGVEFASVWASFGATVTIVEALPHLLPAEDEALSKQLERQFRRRGIGFELGARFAGVEQSTTGVVVSLENGKTLDADLLLVAVGRGPVSEGLGYDEVGVAMDRGYVLVDDHCRTNVPQVYAVGDLIPTLQLAHVGFAEGILVAEQVAGLQPRPIDYAGVPRITYSEPEVASVGLTEAQAREKHGDAVVTTTYDLAGNGKSQILKTAGVVKLVAVREGESVGPVVGVHLVGSRVGELLAEGQLIYNWEAYADDVASLLHAHPTQSEAMGEAHMALAGKPLHAHS
ncbi:MAG: dihydrolipoyl dehydrogenase [Actinomycetes bacterium]